MGLGNRKNVFWVCEFEQQRHRPDCAFGQSDQCLCYLLIGKQHILTYNMQTFIFCLVSVAEQDGLILTWQETLKTGFLGSRPIYA